jgi:hypothetical protein
VPVTETGRSSARRNPFWTLSLEGAKMDWSLCLNQWLDESMAVDDKYLTVTSIAFEALPSKREGVTLGNLRVELHFRSCWCQILFVRGYDSILTRSQNVTWVKRTDICVE